MRIALLLLLLVLSAPQASADFLLSDGTIIVTGRSSLPSLVHVPEFAKISAVIPPVPDPTQVKVSEDGLVWNKWDSGNFVVLSLDKTQGQQIKSEIESMRKRLLSDFGLESDHDTICKVVCVPDSATLKKFFGLDVSHCEVKRNPAGAVESSAIWLNLEERESLPSLLISACAEEAIPDGKWFVLRGMSLLCSSPNALKNLLAEIPEIDCPVLFEVSREKWSNMNADERNKFDKSSAAVCLLVRREFGKFGFAKFLANQHPSSLGFDGFSDFGKVVDRYSENLSSDIKSGRAPDNYLVVTSR
jgi:hypothetical protein